MNNLDLYYQPYSRNNPSYNVVRIAGAQIRRQAEKHFRGTLLDVGCGSKEKIHLVGDLVNLYIGVDLPGTLHNRSAVDIFGTAYKLPVTSLKFDCVLCTAVLEHLEEPEEALQEAFRVLKPGGRAIYTAPFFWHLHEEPRDFYRYSRYGLQYLFEKVGFTQVEVLPLAGFWVTFAAQIGYYLQRFRRGPAKPAVDIICLFLNWMSRILDRGIFRDERFAWMHLVVAQKPVEPSGGT